jgi:hypothetical protein
MVATEMVSIRDDDPRVTITARWDDPELVTELCAAFDFVVAEPAWQIAVLDVQILPSTTGPVSVAIASFVAAMASSDRRVLVVLGCDPHDNAVGISRSTSQRQHPSYQTPLVEAWQVRCADEDTGPLVFTDPDGLARGIGYRLGLPGYDAATVPPLPVGLTTTGDRVSTIGRAFEQLAILRRILPFVARAHSPTHATRLAEDVIDRCMLTIAVSQVDEHDPS